MKDNVSDSNKGVEVHGCGLFVAMVCGAAILILGFAFINQQSTKAAVEGWQWAAITAQRNYENERDYARRVNGQLQSQAHDAGKAEGQGNIAWAVLGAVALVGAVVWLLGRALKSPGGSSGSSSSGSDAGWWSRS